jgi:hypothetical protein
MLVAARKLQRFVAGMTLEELRDNEVVQSAINIGTCRLGKERNKAVGYDPGESPDISE